MIEPFLPKIEEIFENSLSKDKKQWNKSRKKFLFGYLCSVVEARNVEFDSAAVRLNGNVQKASNLRRIQRFFAEFALDYVQVALLIVSFLPVRKFKLCIDRTNWKFGTVDINILVLSVYYKGAGIPVLFSLLDKQGCSHTAERIDLLDRFIRIFGADRISCLIGDREFIGEQWYKYLLENKIRFYLRIPKHHRVKYEGRYEQAQNFLGSQKVKYMDDVEIEGFHLSMAITKAPPDPAKPEQEPDYVIVLTNGYAKKALDRYRLRWGIEVFFQNAKSRGFNLEKTHLRDLNRIAKLFAVISIASCWLMLIGTWMTEKIKTVPIKNHLHPANSIFRIGLDTFQQAYRHAATHTDRFLHLLDILTYYFNQRILLLYLTKKNVM